MLLVGGGSYFLSVSGLGGEKLGNSWAYEKVYMFFQKVTMNASSSAHSSILCRVRAAALGGPFSES